jgi:hypothetical protein
MALAVTHPTWGLGFGDEVWWSRLAQPAMHTWAPDAQALRLVEKARPKADPEPKALACYGLLTRLVTVSFTYMRSEVDFTLYELTQTARAAAWR